MYVSAQQRTNISRLDSSYLQLYNLLRSLQAERATATPDIRSDILDDNIMNLNAALASLIQISLPGIDN